MQEDSSIKAVHDFARRNQIYVEYRLENESGPTHAKMYTVRLHLGDKDYVGTERSVKLAQCAAAQLAVVDQQSLSSINHYDQDIAQIHASQSSVVTLNSWATQNHLRAHYVFLDENFVTTSSPTRHLFFYRLYLGSDLHFDGHGCSHHQARSHCALNALYFLRQQPVSPPSTPQLCSPSSYSRAIQPDISLMYERAKQLGLAVRVQWNDTLTVTYRIGEYYSATGQGLNRHSAKQIAAEKMLNILPVNINQENAQKSSRLVNPIARLYQLAQTRQVRVEFIPLEKSFLKEKFRFQITFGECETAEGQGYTKQLAKRAAAERLLEKLDTIVVLPPPPTKGLLKRDGNTEYLSKHEKKHVHFVEEAIEKDEQLSARSIVVPSANNSYYKKQQLVDTCQQINIQVQYVDELSENNHSGSSRYQSIVSLSTSDRLVAQFRGHGPSLMRAQENASSAAWNHLKQSFDGTVQVFNCQS